ncbi:MAG: NAD(+)/NADH kinase [Candidatus Gastranaerophilales bacterium]|nr:NAD(+)/NADH kinase [Candidatus Gastranaerophilales bacterium]
MFEKIAIIYNDEIKTSEEVLARICAILKSTGKNYIIQKIIPDCTKKTEEFERDISLAIVIGGDGTLISVTRFYAQFDIPVFGINLGRLGFLAQLQVNEIETGIKKLLSGEYKIEERLMLKCFNEEHKFDFNALNDIVIKGGNLARTERLYLYINDELVSDYLADGLIISTPTGSTAYTLSAGGPIVHPAVDVMIIVPICAHSLAARPLVVPVFEKITIKMGSSKNNVYVTADGQKNFKFTEKTKVHIIQNPKKAKLVFLKDKETSFYSVLKEKLNWGVSPKSNA